MQDLADSGSFASIDAKLATQLFLLCKDNFARKVVLAVKDARASGTMLTGRQILFMICKQFEEDDDRCFTNDLGDIKALKWLGDYQLLTLKSNWDHVAGGLREPQSSDNLRALF